MSDRGHRPQGAHARPAHGGRLVAADLPRADLSRDLVAAREELLRGKNTQVQIQINKRKTSTKFYSILPWPQVPRTQTSRLLYRILVVDAQPEEILAGRVRGLAARQEADVDPDRLGSKQ